jgi:uncharacterized integral membrane protein (TIGR00698 family)
MKNLVPIAAIICLLPVVPAPAALIAGVALALLFGNPFSNVTKTVTPRLMAVSIVGLGAGMDLIEVGRVGLQGFGYTSAGITMAFAIGLALHWLLKTDRGTSILVCAGTAICGGSAIAAVSPVIRAKPHQISVALGVVFLLNAVALMIFPPLGHLFGLSEVEFGLWSALAIHDTSSVVGASMQFGPRALEIGTTVKLARALWIVPMVLVIASLQSREGDGQKMKKPWFILGFVIMAALVTWIPALQGPGEYLVMAAKRLFVMTLFLIGTSFTRQALREVGPKILFQGITLWLLVSAGSLALIRSGWAGTP